MNLIAVCRLGLFSVFVAGATLGEGYGAERYFCAADQSVGFRWDGSGWVRAEFITDDDEFLLTSIGDTDGLVEFFHLDKLGETDAYMQCERKPFAGVVKSDFIECGSLLHSVIINVGTLEYQEIYALGYISGDARTNTPSFTIGRCALVE